MSRLSAAVLAVATVVGVWLGVTAPDRSPVTPVPVVQLAPGPGS